MKSVIATAALFLMACVCFAAGQPSRHPARLSITDLFTYNNLTSQKSVKNNAPKVYALQQEATENKNSCTTTSPYNSQSPEQTFTPTPLINFYKELL